MLKAIVIDDDSISICALINLLKKLSSFEIDYLGTANNLKDGVELINHFQPDIVFLDINMPGENGLAIYNYYKDPEFKIIFTTGYPEYSLEALKMKAFDYLLKPISIIELKESLQKAILKINLDRLRASRAEMTNCINIANIHGKEIIFCNERGFVKVNTKNIEYCSGEQAYSYITTNDNKKILVTKKLIDLENQLPKNQFYRTHKSYLVNIHYIVRFVRAINSFVELKNGDRIPVSVRKSSVILKEINQLLLRIIIVLLLNFILNNIFILFHFVATS